jgi:hypothetical protein
VILVITSLLSILLTTLHLTSDTIYAKAGTPEAGGSTLVTIPILVLWLYGTLLLNERRSGHVIMLIGSLLALAMPVVHVAASGGAIAKTSPAFLFVWTMHALGLTGLFGFMLSVQGLWTLRRANPR